jgi:hypothetical protein
LIRLDGAYDRSAIMRQAHKTYRQICEMMRCSI